MKNFSIIAENATWLPDAASTMKSKLVDMEAEFKVKFPASVPPTLKPHDIAHPVEIEFEGESLNLMVAKFGSSSPKKLMSGHLEGKCTTAYVCAVFLTSLF